MEIVRIDERDMEQAIHAAIEVLENSGLIAFPTETFYGLGVKFDVESTLKRLYDLKHRPKDKAMPLIIGKNTLLPRIASIVSKKAANLMDKFWPGPLTLILPAQEGISEFITAGTQKVAVRIPGKSFALQLAKAASFPITATSANISGHPPAQNAETVRSYFGDAVDLIIDGGPAPGGLPSTIVDVTGDSMKILRAGVIRKESLESIF
jgi:L-threonylcarbamoyladenylate synthase